MKLTPLDIHHKEFRNSLRGYNAEEVDTFLDEVADEFERLFKENIDLSEKYEAANERVRSYVEIEKTLHNTMLAAQTSAEAIKAKAEAESDMLMRDAELKAKELIQLALTEKQRAQAELLRIKTADDDFRLRFRAMLEEYLRSVREVSVDPEAAGLAAEELSDATAGIEAVADSPTTDDEEFAPPAFMRPAEPAPSPETGRPIEPFAADMAAAMAADADVPARPHARVPRRADGNTQPLPMDEPPSTGFVQALALGEVEGPDVRQDTPTFEDPDEFTMPRRGPVGERDDDGVIEEID